MMYDSGSQTSGLENPPQGDFSVQQGAFVYVLQLLTFTALGIKTEKFLKYAFFVHLEMTINPLYVNINIIFTEYYISLKH